MTDRTPYIFYTAACPGCGRDLTWVAWGEKAGPHHWTLNIQIDCSACDQGMAVA